MLFEVRRVVRDVDPAAVRDALRVELKDDLGEVEVFRDPLCEVCVWDAWDFDVGGLAFAVVRGFAAPDFGVDFRVPETGVDFDALAVMVSNRLKNLFSQSFKIFNFRLPGRVVHIVPKGSLRLHHLGQGKVIC